VLEARAFAVDSLGLEARRSFTRYTDLGRDTLVLVLSAAHRDRLEPYSWWFPIVGRVPYKGYFDLASARKAADGLRARGFDVYLRPSSAFSTLGWFDDPVLSTTLREDSVDLANTVVHELTHNGFYAPGQAVFPGGGVDPRDRDVEVSWAGPPPSEWAARLRCDARTARGLVCAAVRETFEESGVLLAGDDADTVVGDTTGTAWEADRLALESRERSLADLLRRRRLVLRSDLLGAWAHWVTPRLEPRRYDTRFFVAVLPAGQRTRDVSSESDAVAWMRPADVLDAVRDGRLAMMPPTVQTCVEIAELGHAADALPAAAARSLVTVEPRLVVEGDDVWLEIAGPEEEPS